ncbi:benzoate transporter [Nocardia sp. SYP-A9097]|nr:benzoate/H(+) symporter BenE family transporter [Nocardia sp. SYP-A9097]MRH91866.1 benzoate transporter [Nocardia sp. SYP-A9097]
MTADSPLETAETSRPRLASPRQVLRDLDSRTAANGLIGLVFSATGPLAVIVTAGGQGHLTAAQLASWIFGAFFLNGLLTILVSWVYRRPLGFFWTIPGTVLVGNALPHMTWSQVIGVYVVTAILIVALGLSGLVDSIMKLLPTPIVMAMVAGVFLHFGTGLVQAVSHNARVAAPMIIVFVLLSAWPRGGALIPPVLGALAAGIAAVASTTGFSPTLNDAGPLAVPVFTAPEFSANALAELVIPLAVTVLVVQNGQGIAVLEAARHRVPVTAVTIACGIWSLFGAGVGAVSTCLTGPTNALLVASGQRERQYTAAIVCGLLALVAGIFAPVLVALMLSLPAAYIGGLAGLAMLAALRGAFLTAFSGRHTMGALIAFLVTVAGIDFGGISAAFWGLVAGILASRLLDPSQPA